MIKGSNHQEAVIIKSTYIPNTRTHKYMKHVRAELKGENDSNTIILGNFSKIGRKSKHKMNKDTKNKINTVDKGTSKTYENKAAEYKFFQSVHSTFS